MSDEKHRHQGYYQSAIEQRELSKTRTSMDNTQELEARLRLQPEDAGGPSRMDMLRERIEAADALAAMRAENEALTLILDACTEGTEWTYAQVPDELKALRAAAPKE